MNYVYQVENMPHAGPMTDGYVWRDEVLEIAARADAQIAELQRSITIRDTEIARLETDLELARRDAGRYLAIKPHVSPGLVTHIYEDGSRLTFTEWSFAGVFAGAFRGDTLDEAIDAGPWWRKDAARAGNGGGV